MLRLMIFLLLVVALPGCRLFDDYPSNYPLIADDVEFTNSKSAKALTFAVTAERRFVMLFPDENGGIKVCAEPSPDVAQTTAELRQLGAALQTGDLEGLEGASAAVNNLSYYATAALLLTQRSQGLQIYRDGMYYYCQMYIQGVISKDEYFRKEDELRLTASKLIEKQIPNLPNLASLAPPGTPIPPLSKIDPPQPLVQKDEPAGEQPPKAN